VIKYVVVLIFDDYSHVVFLQVRTIRCSEGCKPFIFAIFSSANLVCEPGYAISESESYREQVCSWQRGGCR
jgi:hypothetical protein